MQEKTSRINAAMKAQTFGVEIECNNITRQKAAAALAEFFGTNRTRFTGTYYNVYEAQDAKGRCCCGWIRKNHPEGSRAQVQR